MKYVNGNTPRCKDCKWFEYNPNAGEKPSKYYNDGLCRNVNHHTYESAERRKAGRPVGSLQSACFDGENRTYGYECTMIREHNGVKYPQCGGAVRIGNIVYCTHENGLIDKNYSNQRCGGAKRISTELDQIEMEIE